MNPSLEDLRKAWLEDLRAMVQTRGFSRLFLIGLATKFAAVLFLGIAFFIVWYGLWYGLTRLAMYWAPIYRALARIEGRQLGEAKPAWVFAPITVRHIPGLVLKVAISLGSLTYGLWLLFHLGFCRQNFICLFLR